MFSIIQNEEVSFALERLHKVAIIPEKEGSSILLVLFS